MFTRPRLLMLVSLLVASCRRDVSKLDEVQKMAYGVKPAVVRISAYATAQFHYQPAAVSAVQAELRAGGFNVEAREIPHEPATVQAGAGGSGSGFIVHPDGEILTSGHVVAPTRDAEALRRDLLRNGAISAMVKHFPIDDLRAIHRRDGLDRYITTLATNATVDQIAVVDVVELSNGEKLPFRIVRYSPSLSEHGTDLALLRIERKNLPVLPLGDSDTTRVGESIWSVGYPAVASSTDDVIGGWLSRDSDLEATFNPGTITAIKRNVANTPVFQSNVAIYRGNSGGPAVDRDGAVIGISTWGHTDAESIKFLVPINVARDVMAAAGVPQNVDGEFSRHYRLALDDAGEGNWSQSESELAIASRLFPNSPDLIRFRRRPARELSVITTVQTMVAPIERDTNSLAPGPNAAPPMLGRFTILNGSRAGEKLGLGGSGIRIGREATICEIVLENPKISRLHAEVVAIDGKVLLIDRNSSNGTFVNDQKIDKRFLKDGDIIYFGGRNAVAVAFHA